MQLVEQAIDYLQSGRSDEALDLLQKQATIATDDEQFTIAEVYTEWGFFEEAIAIVENLLHKYPTEGQLLTKLASLYIEMERDDEAIDLLNEIKSDHPFYMEALFYLADLYEAQGLFEVAEQKLLEAKKIDGDEIIIDFALGELLFSIGQLNRAIPFYEKVLQKTDTLNDVSIIERLAECHAMFGYYDLALDYYEQIDSDNPDVLFKYGFTAAQVKRNDIAMNVWKQLIDIDPHYYTAYFELGTVMMEEGLYQDAYDIVNKGLQYDEYQKELYFLAGKLAVQLNQVAESMQHFQEAIALDSDYKEAVLALIQLYKNTGDDQAIIELIEDIEAEGAEDPLYDWEKAKAYVELETYDQALKSYQQASKGLMHDSEFLKEYGFYLSEEGLNEEAITILKAYIEKEPLDEETEAFIHRLVDANLP